MGVGIGTDDKGNIRTVVGTSEPNGYLRPGVTLNPGEELADGLGHAEISILDYMKQHGIARSG
jgi:filamentous hemagglutinin